MSTYTLPEVLHMWDKGELTPEQAIGHLLQHHAALIQRLAEVEKRLRQLEQSPAGAVRR
jgi:hypothetical protein